MRKKSANKNENEEISKNGKENSNFAR